MSLFRKNKTKEELNKQEPDIPLKEPVARSFMPDSEQLAHSKKKAEEEIKTLESKIQEQREMWSTKLKAKEEEKISLTAQFEMLTRKAQAERDSRERELNLLEQQVQRDLAEADKSLNTEIKAWTERLGNKDKELEQTRQEAELLETRKRIESEQSIRNLKSQLEQVEQKHKNAQRKLLEEQNNWIAKIKAKEDDIIGIKTQLSIKESSLAIENEKDTSLRREKEATWSNQIREIEDKLKTQDIEFAKEYKRKQEELTAFKAALESRLGDISIEAERKEREAASIAARMEERIKYVNEHITQESKRWQNAVKERDEEFNKLKVELMLNESQEKTQRENKFSELKEAEALANRKIKDIRQKIDEEKAKWKNTVDSKEEELKLFRIQAELKLKEIQGMWEKRKAKAIEDKAGLEIRLGEIKLQFEQEKTKLKTELDAKANEIESYSQKWAEDQIRVAASAENSLLELRARKESLTKELGELEEGYKSEKAKWDSLLVQKEKEVNVLRSEYRNRESTALRELEAAEMQLNREQQPLTEKLKEYEKRIQDQKNNALIELARKDDTRAAVEKQYKSREESLVNRYHAQEQKLKADEDALTAKTNDIKKQIEEYSQQTLKAIEELKAEEDATKEKLFSQDRRMAAEKEKIARVFKDRKAELEKAISLIEEEQLLYKDKLKAELEEKSRVLEEVKVNLQEKEKQLHDELKEKEIEQLQLKAKSEAELSALTTQLHKNNELAENNLRVYRESIAELSKSLKEKDAQSHLELKALKEEWESKLQPIYENRRQIELKNLASKKEAEEKFSIIDQNIKLTRDEFTIKEVEHSKRLALEENNIVVAKEKMAADIASLNGQIEAQSILAKENLDRLAQKEKFLENSIQVDEQKLQSERQRIVQHYENQQKQLAGIIEKLEMEYLSFMQQANQEIRAKNTELALEDSRLREISEKNRKEISQKEHEYLILESNNKKELILLNERLQKAHEEWAQKIKSQEESIDFLNKSIVDNTARYEKNIESLRSELAGEIQPLEQRRQELKQSYEKERKGFDEKLLAASKRIEALKIEQSSKMEEFEMQQADSAAEFAKAKQYFDNEVQALLESKSKLDKESTELIASKNLELETLQKQADEKAESFEKQKAELISHEDTVARYLKSEIEGIEKETARLQKEYPQMLLERENDITALNSKIEQKTNENRAKIELADKSADNYQRRAERRITQLKIQLSEVQENHKKELESAEVKLAVIHSDMARKETVFQEEITKEGKAFTEQKYNLEKQKSELEEIIKDLQSRSREELRQKEKEVLIIQSELAEKEKAWEQNWKQKEQELTVEKDSLNQELESLNSKLKEEEDAANKKLSEKEKEIRGLENAFHSKSEEMSAQLTSKKRLWEETNAALKIQEEELENKHKALVAEWDETKAMKEKELAVLKSNLEFWELRSKQEEEKRLMIWEEEKLDFERKIQNVETELGALRKNNSAKYEEKETALYELKTQAEEAERSKILEFKEAEEKFFARRDVLSREIAAWEKKMKEESAGMEKNRKDIEHDIEKLKLESTLKETEAMSEREKAERKWRRAKRDLEEQLGLIERQFAEERDNYASKLNIKSEEITTLKVRNTLRDERRQAEVKHRKEEIQKIMETLEAGLGEIENKYKNDIGTMGMSLQKSKEELESIKNELAGKEENWNKELEEREKITSGNYATIMKGLEDAESELANESKRFAQLLDIKEKQIANLTSQMKFKEENLALDRDYSQMVIQNLQKKSGEMQGMLRKLNRSARENEKEGMVKSFESAIELYNNAKYGDAKATLLGILKQSPEFAGAYQYLALCSWNTGDKQEARNMARRAYELEPHNEELKLWIEYIEKEINNK